MLFVLPVLCLLYPIFIVQLILFSKPKYLSSWQISCAIANGAAALVAIFESLFILKDLLMLLAFVMGMTIFAFLILRIRQKLAAVTTMSYLAINMAVV